MNFIMRENLQFDRDNTDISISGEQFARYFKIDHLNRLMPLIKEIRNPKDENFRECTCWHPGELKYIPVEYLINKAGCILLCKKIKAKPALKNRFLRLIEAV